MNAVRSLLLILASLPVLNSHGIIIRHDVGPSRYEVRTSDYAAVFFLEQQGNRKVCVATDNRGALHAGNYAWQCHGKWASLRRTDS